MDRPKAQNMPRPGHELPKQEAAKQAEIEKALADQIERIAAKRR